uniref:PAS domain-containing protein n=1 Tax=Lotharella globosa TaxID=91324 RepID=A0A6V3KBF0_9EUKA|eukprot:CAMPEP_0167785198 /NCGR_PEP_ID=MMETSP0111_2-20121227/8104_1 /TAXON_ID=91324 /ORGANISM="Lotharella globosa, Strain CCCM811" /LENGTH=199 /DNA_ID=CAMNT_0007676443 /DNA_START=105 /DNA_END=704 /DNA_ORIENTATION=-
MASAADLTNLPSYEIISLCFASAVAAWGLGKMLTQKEDNEEKVEMLPEKLRFKPKKKISLKDKLVLDMLSTHSNLSWCVTDPDIDDNPIAYSSPGFCRFTGYKKSEIEGVNCRFLQGKETKEKDIEQIREAIRKREERSVCILNYRKDGTPFFNQFYLMPLLDTSRTKVLYFLGVQVEVDTMADGQEYKNPAWVYALCK